jgi:hypothetical protein
MSSVINDEDDFDGENVEIWQNNLGDQGPGCRTCYIGPDTIAASVYEDAMVLGNMVTMPDEYAPTKKLALVIRPWSVYSGSIVAYKRNGIDEEYVYTSYTNPGPAVKELDTDDDFDEVAQINIATSFDDPEATVFNFMFIDPEDECGDYESEPPCNTYTMERFFVTFYDFDESSFIQERMSAKGFVFADFSGESELTPPLNTNSPRAIDMDEDGFYLDGNPTYGTALNEQVIVNDAAPSGEVRRYTLSCDDSAIPGCDAFSTISGGTNSSVSAAGGYLFIDSLVEGGGDDNPTLASSVTDIQWSRSVVFYYENTASFMLAFDAPLREGFTEPTGGRNFLFSFKTPLDSVECVSNPEVEEYFSAHGEPITNEGFGGDGNPIFSRRLDDKQGVEAPRGPAQVREAAGGEKKRRRLHYERGRQMTKQEAIEGVSRVSLGKIGTHGITLNRNNRRLVDKSLQRARE